VEEDTMVATAQSSELILSPDADVDTPALVVSEEILHRNIAEMASFAKSVGVNLRPHIKTHKTPQIARLQLAAGAFGITCAKVGEAEVMVEQAGVEDVLLAYPTIGEHKFRRIVALMERARIVVAVDSLDAAKAMSAAMARHDRSLDIYVEVNTGQNRSGVKVGDEAVQFALEIARMPNLNLVGIMTHEGHVNSMDLDTIEAAAIEAGKAMVQMAEQIRSHGIELPTVSVGSTPAARFTPTVPGITEMRPGTYVFNDNSLFRFGDSWGVQDCAARFVATVVSRTAPDRCVLDTGSKSLAMDPSKSHPGHGYIVGHPDVVIAKLSEEHGVCELPAGEEGFEVGDRVEVIPNHICPTVNLMNELFIAREGKIVDTWKIAARGMVR
jgi:D-serine deaminase-like pyridoxal phosphate-dependent protein